MWKKERARENVQKERRCCGDHRNFGDAGNQCNFRKSRDRREGLSRQRRDERCLAEIRCQGGHLPWPNCGECPSRCLQGLVASQNDFVYGQHLLVLVKRPGLRENTNVNLNFQICSLKETKPVQRRKYDVCVRHAIFMLCIDRFSSSHCHTPRIELTKRPRWLGTLVGHCLGCLKSDENNRRKQFMQFSLKQMGHQK